MTDPRHIPVPDYCRDLRVYGCCYDEEHVVLVYIEELKRAA